MTCLYGYSIIPISISPADLYLTVPGLSLIETIVAFIIIYQSPDMLEIVRTAPCNNVSCICGQQRLRSANVSMQSDQGLHCLLTESLDTTECMNGEQRPQWYNAHTGIYH